METKTEKNALVKQICNDLAQASSYTKASGAIMELEDKLRLTRIGTLRQMAMIVSTINIKKPEKEEEGTAMEWIPPVPWLLQPIDVQKPKNAEKMFEQMLDIHGMTVRLTDAWSNGDLPSVKRFSRCISRVISNLTNMVKDQLYDGLNDKVGVE